MLLGKKLIVSLAPLLSTILFCIAPADGIAQDVRGYRTIYEENGIQTVGIGFLGSIETDRTIREALPAHIAIIEAHAVKMVASDPPAVETILITLPPAIPDNGLLWQDVPVPADSVVAIYYHISPSLVGGETVGGEITGGPGSESLENGFLEPTDGIFDQLNAIQQQISQRVNNFLCTAFSIIPGPYDDSYNSDCGGAPAPKPLSFNDGGGGHVLSNSNQGESKLSVGIGSVLADKCNNQVELSFVGQTFLPAIQGEFRVGGAFQIQAVDPRNNGKRAQAEVTIRGGNTGLNPYGYEGLIETFSINPFPPPVPPAPPVVYPSGSVVTDRIRVQFGTGQGAGYVMTHNREINATTSLVTTAAPSTCDCDEQEPQDSYSETFTLDLYDGNIYESRTLSCAAGITLGSAGGAYSYYGNVPTDFFGCPLPGPVDCYDVNPDVVSNQRRGLRLEDVRVDFKHMDLKVESVAIDDYTPLEGVVAQVIAVVTNEGEGDGELVEIRLFDNNVPMGFWELPTLAAGERDTLRFAWDTTGLFGQGTHTLRVEMESRTIAEVDYSDNSGSVSGIEVQESIKAAFISVGASLYYPDLANVYVYDSETLRRIGTLDLYNAGAPHAEPARVAVPNDGLSAWLVIEDYPSQPTFGVVGMDVMSCYSGNCAVIEWPPEPGPGPWPSNASGDINVRTDGAYAFVHYRDAATLSYLAAYPLDALGADPPAYEQLHPVFQFKYGLSTLDVFPSTTLREELSLVRRVSGPNRLGMARMGVSDRTFTSGATSLGLENYVIDMPGGSGSVGAGGVGYTGGSTSGGHTLGSRVVVLDDNASYSMITLHAACPGSTTKPAPACRDGHAYFPTTDFPDVIVANREGDAVFATPPRDYYWHYDPSFPNSAPAPSTAACAGSLWPYCYVEYQDAAITFPLSRFFSAPQREVWLVRTGNVDIYKYPRGPSTLGLPLPNEEVRAVTIAPIPYQGTPGLYPGRIPDPGPPDGNSSWNLIFWNPFENPVISLQMPVVNPTGGPTTMVLEFMDLPSGWIAGWNPPDLDNIPPFEKNADNIVYVPVDIDTGPGGWVPEEPLLLQLRAYPLGSIPEEATVFTLRIDPDNCPEAKFDDGEQDGQAVVGNPSQLTSVAKQLTAPLEDSVALEAHIWVYGRVSGPSGTTFSLQVNGTPALDFDPTTVWDPAVAEFEWKALPFESSLLNLSSDHCEILAPTGATTLEIGIDTDSNLGRSSYSAGTSCTPSPCGGELMIRIRICEDCNHNGVSDPTEVADGRQPDVNLDGIPDACQASVGVDDSDGTPKRTRLLASFPNPFNPKVTLRFELSQSGTVRIAIYNVSGKLVREVVSEHYPAGGHSVEWDGRDASGSRIASGVYLVQLEAGGVRSTEKLVLLK